MARLPKVHVVASKRELRALAAPARQEIVDALEHAGAASVSELAVILARPADALYYHLRVLKRAGLVVETAERMPGGKQRARFRMVAERLHLDYGASRRANLKPLLDFAGGMLRLGLRDFRAAALDPKVVVSGPRRELWAARTVLWMSAADVAKTNRIIEGFREMSRRRRRGRLFAVTVLLVPLRRGRPRSR